MRLQQLSTCQAAGTRFQHLQRQGLARVGDASNTASPSSVMLLPLNTPLTLQNPVILDAERDQCTLHSTRPCHRRCAGAACANSWRGVCWRTSSCSGDDAAAQPPAPIQQPAAPLPHTQHTPEWRQPAGSHCFLFTPPLLSAWPCWRSGAAVAGASRPPQPAAWSAPGCGSCHCPAAAVMRLRVHLPVTTALRW